jgi:hypothetical protein
MKQEYITQDAQKGHGSHPPSPGAPRRAVPQARPQRAKRRGGTYRTSCGPFAHTIWSRRTEKPLQHSHVEPLSDARTPLADFVSILLDHRLTVEEWRKTGHRDKLGERGGGQLRTRLGTMNQMGNAKLFCRNQTALIIIHVERPCRVESQ